MTIPKVSIIVPVYNVEKYLPRCIESLMSQTLQEIEIILVDDGSPDNSPKLCDEYTEKDYRVKVIHKKNGGLGFARNSGIDIATGEFLAFVDSDDYVATSMFRELYNTAKKYNLDTVYCGYNRIDNKLRIQPIKDVQALKVIESQDDIQEVLLDMIGTEPNSPIDRKYEMSVWHAIYARSIVKEHHVIFPSEREFISEDIIFHMDYLQKAKRIAFLPESLYYYCSNESSLTTSYRSDRFSKNKVLYKEICRKLSLISEKKEYQLRAGRLFIGYTRFVLFSIGQQSISSSEKKKIIKAICKDNIWNELFEYYPYKELPFKYGFILECIKRHWINLILIIISLENLIRKKK
ncbi:glycosyltransferase [Emticicia sp. BO119]|uniref:glycosyltransferase n=1 Tax=Emticicia sp. BO119 TaxID=2757768 RepID=UPI0015F0F1EC|nr:glycosyltransferase [Emticicia sp. BO119]MBA4850525.1 glycosyltransferase [Emticicia sp. BO119]